MGNQQTLGCSGGDTAASNPASGPAHSNRFDTFFCICLSTVTEQYCWAYNFHSHLSNYRDKGLLLQTLQFGDCSELQMPWSLCLLDWSVMTDCNPIFSWYLLFTRSNNNNDSNVKQAGSSSALSTVSAAKKKPKSLREKNRFGTVIVKVASLSSNRRVQERQNIFTITPRGALFHGTQCNPALVQKGKKLTCRLGDIYCVELEYFYSAVCVVRINAVTMAVTVTGGRIQQ